MTGRGSRVSSRLIARLRGHTGPIQALTFSSGPGQYILTGSSDRTVKLWNPSKAVLIQSYSGSHGHSVLSVAVSADNSRFVSGGGERTAEIFTWDVATARTTRRFGDHTGRVEAVTYAGENDSVMISGGFDAAVRIWDCRSQSMKPIMILRDAKDCITSIITQGADIFAAGVDGRVRCYDIRMGSVYVDVVGSPICSVSITQQADSLLTTSLDSTIRLLDKSNGSLLKLYNDPQFRSTDYRVRSTMASNDACVVSGAEDGHVYVWDTLSGERIQRVKHVEDPESRASKNVVTAVSCKKGTSEWASAGGDGTVCVWG